MTNKEIMLNKKVWAVVGANEDHKKFGNKIYKRLKSRGYEVFPVNPRVNIVEGDICYKSLSALPKLPEVIDIVVAPKIAKSVIEEAAKLGIKYIWFQPSTYDDDVLQFAKESGLEIVQDCVLVALP